MGRQRTRKASMFCRKSCGGVGDIAAQICHRTIVRLVPAGWTPRPYGGRHRKEKGDNRVK